MADDKIWNKVITIESKEESKTANGNTMVKITDHTGEKFNYFKKKKDGSPSAVAEQFKNMSLDEGSTVRIGYVIETYQDKKGVTRESHKIINFMETDQEPAGGQTPSQTAPQPQKPRGEAPISSQTPSKGTDWDEIAVGKCQTQFLAAYIQSGHSIQEALVQVEVARKLAKKVVYGIAETIKDEPLPTIQQDDGFNPMINDLIPETGSDVDVEGIPY